MSDQEKPTLWIHAENVALGPLRADLSAEYWRWESDPHSVLGYGRQVPESAESRAEGLQYQLRGAPEQLRFTVYDTSDAAPSPVGLTSLLIDHQVRTAEFVIVIAPEARGKHMGTTATRLTLDYAFHLVGLHMVWLKVLEPNTAGIRAYENAGFRRAGALRDAGNWLGERCSEIMMDAVRADFPWATSVETTPVP